MILIFGLSLLAACGGGGGGTSNGDENGTTVGGSAPTGDTMSVSIWDLSTSTTTTKYLGDAYDPIMSATTSTTTNKTYINMSSGYNLYTYSWKKQLNITISGTTPGTYLFSSPTATTRILYSNVPTIYQGTSGSVTITSIGNDVGSSVTGTFNANLECVSSCTGTIGMSGSFNVKRSQ